MSELTLDQRIQRAKKRLLADPDLVSRVGNLLASPKRLDVVQEPKAKDSSDVYFIQDERGRVKIGESKDPNRRMGTMQTGNAEELRIVLVIPGLGREGEQKLHDRFSEYRIRNSEWFEPGDSLIMFIRRNQKGSNNE